jgi:hypothetical protein
MGLRVGLVEAVSSAGVAAGVGIVGDAVGLEDIVGAAGLVAGMPLQIAVAEAAQSEKLKGRGLDDVDTVDTVAAVVVVRVQAASTCSLAAQSIRSSVI